jgi:carboxymethylenebutenolidase
MREEQISILENDGSCRAWVMTPSGVGPWPAVIFYMDGFGIRPGMLQMASHLSSKGFLVLLPDMYYRFGEYAPLEPAEVLKGDVRATVGPMMASTDNHRAARDTAAFIAYLDTRGDVAGKKVGTVGFCLGGGMALAAAAYYPDRIAAAASFHGGNLATDEPTSPHLLLPKVKAELYIAIADNDRSYPPEMDERFQTALRAAGVRSKSELYPGKAHGWMKPDLPVYDGTAAERGWNELLALYARALVPAYTSSSQ